MRLVSKLLIVTALRDPDARAIVARMSPRPNKRRQDAIQALVLELKAKGLWQLLRDLFIMAAHAEQPSRLNWKAVRDITWSGAVPFTVDRGIRASATATAVFDYDNVTPDSHVFGAWWRQDALEQRLERAIAGISGSADISDYAFSNGGINITVNYANQSTSGGRPPSVSEAFIAGRVQGTSIFGHINGLEGSGSRNRPLPRVQAPYGVNAVRSGSTFTAPTPGIFRACWTGSLMTAAQTNSLRAALTTYLQKIGAIA